ncbi:MAG: site-2 protease family protein [Puniceicoccales bacterium]|jgi:Zn-dependent protease|nr:site-2 protease family protein [Puniceicoccales bacterium]
MNLHALADAGIWFVILLVSIALHEFGHAWVADLRGDPLPRQQGRVTLDPFAHFDPIGTFLIPGIMIFLPILMGMNLPIAIIGWGKPVQISLPNRKTWRMDDILITLAGPAANLLIAFIASIIGGILLGYGATLDDSGVLQRVIVPFIYVNVMLIFFNLIPIPPLDGSHIMRHLVNMKEETYFFLSRNGWWVLLILINIPGFRKIMGFAIEMLASPFIYLVNLLAGLIRG